jgi:serine/threonine protein phosphatase 1
MTIYGGAKRTVAIADLHGEITLLHRLLAQLPTQGIQLLFLGDYLDRGEDSLATIQTLTELARERSCIFLRGNHDAAWLEVWTGERFRRCPAIPGARAVWEQIHGQVPPWVGAFLERTAMDWEDVDAYYSHAGALPGCSFRDTPMEVKIWGTDGFLASTYDWGKPVVFGHYEFAEPLLTRTKMGIDTAAYRTGILTALDVRERCIIQAAR